MRTADRMRAVVAGMDAREDTLLRTLTAEAEQRYRGALITWLGGTSLPLLAAIAWFLGTGRSRRRTMAAADAITELAVRKEA